MQPDLPIWAQYLQALSVPTVAVFGLYIGYRQWLTAHEKVKLDLFDRRLEAYRRLKDAVAPVNASGKVRNEDADAFAHAMHDMRFLFDEEMEGQVEQIYNAMLNKHALDLQLDSAADRKNALIKSSELFTCITKGIYTTCLIAWKSLCVFAAAPNPK
jgi:hypothetical protein